MSPDNRSTRSIFAHAVFKRKPALAIIVIAS